MKYFFVLFISSFLCSHSLCSSQPPSKTVSFGPEKQANILVFFQTKATHQEILEFWKEHFFSNSQIDTVLSINPVQGHSGAAITFKPTATVLEIDSFQEKIKKSPLIYKIFLNEKPNNIKILENTTPPLSK